jgi:hypothetical protein
MRQFRLILFLFFCSFLGLQTAKADHMMGASLQFRALGGDSFLVQVYDYRDCNGISFVNSPIYITPQGAPYGITINGNASNVGRDITPVCHSVFTRCQSGSSTFAYGTQLYIINYSVNLKNYSACQYTISWNQCCRSAAITTGATWDGFYIDGMLNKCNLKGASPQFLFDPIILMCKGVCVNRFQSASSEPGDSLVYQLAAPLSAQGTSVKYDNLWSYQKPFTVDTTGDCAGFNFNSQTGELRFRPMKEEVTVYAIRISQYQKVNDTFKKVSEVVQDIQTIVIACPPNASDKPNSPPVISLDSIAQKPLFLKKNQKIDLTATVTDPDKDSLNVNWMGFTGPTFVYKKDSLKTVTLKWQPGAGDVRKDPYQWLITAMDTNVCPIPGKTQKLVQIYVRDTLPVSISKSASNCQWCYSAVYPSGSKYSLRWFVNNSLKSTGSTLCLPANRTGQSNVRLIAYGLEGSYIIDDTLRVNGYTLSRNKDTVCVGDTVVLTAAGNYAFTWKPAATLKTGANGVAYVSPMANTWYSVTAYDSVANCSSTDSILVVADTSCVWPGDANRDKVVNGKDLLCLGIVYGAKGYSRDTVSSQFKPFRSRNWNKTLAGVDLKFMDCNGDGIINDDDTLAIASNFSSRHLAPRMGGSHKTDIPLSITFDKKIYNPGDTLIASVKLGVPGVNATDAYGFLMDYNCPDEAVATVFPAAYQSAFLFNNVHTLSLYKELGGVQSYSQTLVRTDHTGIPGNGEIAQLRIALKPVTGYSYPAKDFEFALQVDGFELIDKNGNPMSVDIATDKALIKGLDTSTGISSANVAGNISIYPNPANTAIFIRSEFKNAKISLYDITGKEMQTVSAPAGNCLVETTALPAGIYVLSVKNNDASVLKQIVIRH